MKTITRLVILKYQAKKSIPSDIGWTKSPFQIVKKNKKRAEKKKKKEEILK